MKETPHNFEAEQSLLGSLLFNVEAFHSVSAIARAEHFSDPMHGKIFEAIGALVDRGQVVNVMTLKTYFDSDEDLQKAGGQKYLVGLVAASGHPQDAPGVALLVRDLYRRRKLIELTFTASVAAAAPTANTDATAHIEELERGLYALANDGQTAGGFKPAASTVAEAMEAAEAAYTGSGNVGLSTGLRAIDRLLGGLHRSDLIVLAGRPSMGKTGLAGNIALHAARAYRAQEQLGEGARPAGAAVGFFSLEMSAAQLMTRMLSEIAGVPSDLIRQGRLHSTQFDRVLSAASTLAPLPLFIDGDAGLSMAEIRARARRQHRQHGLGLLIVDYLQMIEGARGRRQENRVQEVSEITRGLKGLAKELNVPVLALSQLSRNVEARTDKRPQLADLRESGSIEQDADVVAFVYRHEYYLERSDKKDSPEHDAVRGRAELIIAKHRNGPTGTIDLAFNGALTKFDDLPEET